VDERQGQDVTEDVQKVLSCVIRMVQKFGKTMTAQVLTGSRNKKVLDFRFDQLSTYGVLKHMNSKEVSNLIEFMISQELLAVEQGSFPTIFVPDGGRDVLLGKRR
ncbi:RQC domain-containing protein, partial [Bacillus sp. SIMBA_161]